MKEIQAELGVGAPELSFVLAEGGRLIDGAWPETPLPDVEFSFGVDPWRPGLNLRWQSRIETRRADEAPRVTVVSPFVTGLAWDYYDDGFKRWETLEQPKREADGAYPLPSRMRLRFALGAMTAERIITLPVRAEGATNF
jgi:hypothetical protein